jgi:predicted small metal-binding protein
MRMPAPETEKAKHLACAEIVPDCSFTASAATEEELLKKVVAHAARDHGITEITPELAAKVKAAIKSR